MSQPKTDPKAKPEEPKTTPEPTRIGMGDLKKMIQDVVGEIMGQTGGKSKKTDDEDDDDVKPAGINSQVQKAIADIRAKEAKDAEAAAEKKSILDEIAELKEKTKEKAPVQVSKLTRLMKWDN